MASKSLKLKIKKGDNVKVIAGAGKGHTGTVLELIPRRLQVKVSGHNMQTHFDKQNSTMTQKEGFVDYSNIALDEAPKRKAKSKKKTTKKAEAKA
jgi:ribosomal protein L24